MKANLVDARGRSCPEPVLLTKKALTLYKDGVDVLVDNITARENIKRFATNLGYKVNVKENGQDILIEIRKE
ncbi:MULTISPECIES: sulfurtransferase TusA family protein [Caloramator]|uniref:TusA-related sulfurtransferase n=1 Tax=Caloramator proteoclasticus DSM 10124 TaxID=1121262 RepID=A0A1M4VK87_9CLOT|nr:MULTISPECIES: sulfurtransferase TusA family protein [Caloramator]SHE69243.1 TusA-related sulfurtransferase [Caloramator proteoclasticus DSM 10124]